MFGWALFLALFVGSYGANIRIANGTDADEGEFPFVVSLRTFFNHSCGATIINEWHVLTAAHCCCDNNVPQNEAQFSIQYGSNRISSSPTERSIAVSKVICNNYNEELLINDVAILRLESPIPQDDSWEPVKLAREFDTTTPHQGVIIGWGFLSQNGPYSELLQKLDVDVYTDDVCAETSHELNQNICFGAPIGGACRYDSGTALLVDGEQVGIASFITAECGTANRTNPNVYVKVPTFLDFIEENSRI